MSECVRADPGVSVRAAVQRAAHHAALLHRVPPQEVFRRRHEGLDDTRCAPAPARALPFLLPPPPSWHSRARTRHVLFAYCLEVRVGATGILDLFLAYRKRRLP